MRRHFILAASALVAMLGVDVGAANAVPLSYTGSITLQPSTNYAGGLPVSVTKFDTSLGTLNSVVISIATNESATVQISNFYQPQQDFAFTNAVATVGLLVTGPALYFSLLSTSATQASGTAFQTSVTSFPGLTGSAFSTPVTEPSANFGTFEGAGLATMNFTALVTGATFGGSSSAPGGALFFGGSASLGVDVTVAYDYTPFSAPEPAGIALIGTAIAALGIARRRRAS